MNVTRESILEWLEDSPTKRKWLADQCEVGTGALSNWLRENKPRPIPLKAAVIIKGLIEQDRAAKMARERTPQNLVLEFNDEDFSKIEKAALESGDPLRKWAKEMLNYAAEEDIESIAEKYKRATKPELINDPDQDTSPKKLSAS